MTDQQSNDFDALQLVAKLTDLETIGRYVEHRATQLGASDSIAYDMDLAVTELVTNSLVHGYPCQSGWIEVEIRRDGSELRVWIRDQAPPFDPTEFPDPDTHSPLERRRLGGMGIYLARRISQAMRYRRLPGGENEILLIFDGSA